MKNPNILEFLTSKIRQDDPRLTQRQARLRASDMLRKSLGNPQG